MATKRNALEGANSGSVTTANSDDDGSDALSLTSGLTYQTTNVLRGAAAAQAVNPGATVVFAAFSPGDPKVQLVWYQAFSAVPAAGAVLGLISYVADTYGARALTAASGALSLQTKGGVTRATSPTGLITAGAYLRFELLMDAGTSATSGSARLAVYLGHSTTLLWDSGAFTGIDTAGTAATTVYALAGKYSGSYSGTLYLDDIGIRTGADAVWAPWPSVSSTDAAIAAPVATMAVTAGGPTVTGSVSATVNAPVATLGLAIVVGASYVSSGAGAPAATLSTSAPAPTISGATSAAVNAIPATIAVSATAPSAGASATVTAPAATLAMQATAPSTTRSASVAAPVATGAISALIPTVTAGGSAIVQSPPATAAVTAHPPAVSTSASMQGTSASLTATVLPPAVSASSTVSAPPAAAALTTAAPSVSGSVSVGAPTATATAAAHPPVVVTGGGSTTVQSSAAVVTVTALRPAVSGDAPVAAAYLGRVPMQLRLGSVPITIGVSP